MNTGWITSKINEITKGEKKPKEIPKVKLNDPVSKIMSKKVQVIDEEEPVENAAREMIKHDIGCTIVTSNEIPKAVITERDFFKKLVALDMGIEDIKAKQLMSYQLTSIPEDTLVIDAMKKMDEYGIRRLPVINNNQLAGIVTETDLLPAVVELELKRTVESIMIGNPVTAGEWIPIDKIASLMGEKDIGCIVIMHEGGISGMLTERDFVKKVLKTKNKKASDFTIEEIMTQPVKTIDPWATLSDASKLMATEGIRRLPVEEERKLKGLITQTDLIRYVVKHTKVN